MRAAIIALMLAACASGTKIVRIETSAKREPFTCYTETPVPEAPAEPDWPTADEDFYRRQYVHRRDYTKMVEFNRDLALWAGTVRDCMLKLTGGQ